MVESCALSPSLPISSCTSTLNKRTWSGLISRFSSVCQSGLQVSCSHGAYALTAVEPRGEVRGTLSLLCVAHASLGSQVLLRMGQTIDRRLHAPSAQHVHQVVLPHIVHRLLYLYHVNNLFFLRIHRQNLLFEIVGPQREHRVLLVRKRGIWQLVAQFVLPW